MRNGEHIRNEAKKTIKAEHLILNWFESTGTLQLQSSWAAAYKEILIQPLAAETERESPDSRQSEETSTSTVLEETDAALPDDLRKEQFPAELVSTSMFAKELDKISTETNSLLDRFAQIDQPNEGDLAQEISILKVRLQEDNNTLKKITEERDSYGKALQITAKELSTANTFLEEQQRQRSTPYPNEETDQEEPDTIQSNMQLQALTAMKT